MSVTEQLRFRAKHSIITALLKVTDDWLQAMDNGHYTGPGAVFIDLHKAFGMVNHELLLSKLARLGIVGKSSDWFEVICRKVKSLLFLMIYFRLKILLITGYTRGV